MEAIELVEVDLEITARVVPDRDRLDFLPGKMPKHYMRFENYVYHFARKLIKEYDGGYWDFLELSNGGFYIRPADYENVTIKVMGNQYNEVVSSDAAGVIVSTLAILNMAAEEEEDPLIDLYCSLKNFINDHPEFRQIRRAID